MRMYPENALLTVNTDHHTYEQHDLPLTAIPGD